MPPDAVMPDASGLGDVKPGVSLWSRRVAVAGAATFIVSFVARSSGVTVTGEDGYRRPRDGQPPHAWFTCFAPAPADPGR